MTKDKWPPAHSQQPPPAIFLDYEHPFKGRRVPSHTGGCSLYEAGLPDLRFFATLVIYMDAHSQPLPSRSLHESPATSSLIQTVSPQYISLPRRTQQSTVHLVQPRSRSVDCRDEQRTPTLPTQPQRLAIVFLRSYDPPEVLAWLKVIRSLGPGYRHRHAPGALTRHEFDALSELEGCTDRLILAWLESFNGAGQ